MEATAVRCGLLSNVYAHAHLCAYRVPMGICGWASAGTTSSKCRLHRYTSMRIRTHAFSFFVGSMRLTFTAVVVVKTVRSCHPFMISFAPIGVEL